HQPPGISYGARRDAWPAGPRRPCGHAGDSAGGPGVRCRRGHGQGAVDAGGGRRGIRRGHSGRRGPHRGGRAAGGAAEQAHRRAIAARQPGGLFGCAMARILQLCIQRRSPPRHPGLPGWTGSGIYRRLILESNANLYAVLAAGFPEDRGGVAIETPDRHYSWDDIDRGSARIANLLRSLAAPGARVAVQVHKSPEALMLYLAALRAGLVYLPLNTAYHESEVAYFVG